MSHVRLRVVRPAVLALLVSASAVGLSASARADVPGELIELSGPVFPRTSVLYASEGANYPSALEDQQGLASDAALPFESLLSSCQPTHPAITLASPGVTLTASQLAINYNEVASCAYTVYTAKPYWIPQLVDDVDICESALGAGWRLPTEADVLGLTEDDFTFLHDTLGAVSNAGGASSMGAFYFSVRVFVRATDGSIQQANLAPSVANRITPLSATGEARKQHYEGGLALRCIRRTPLP
jgi:hypothetical protein